MIYYRQLFFYIHKGMAGKSFDPDTGFILHRAIHVTSVVGYACAQDSRASLELSINRFD